MDGQAGEENYEPLSIDDRLTHKSWKARVSAYTGLVALFRATADESDPVFRSYTSNSESVKDWVKDSNAVSQEKGVEAACALLEWGGKSAARARPDVVPALVEKCLGSARAGTRTKAIELCLLYVEVEEDMGLGVIEDVSVGLSAKQPKVVAGSVTVLKELVLLFGPKSISIKPILPLLSKIFAHSDKTVRAEGTLLCLALHAYLGPALTSHLKDLKPVQLKELTEAFVEADGKGEGFGAAKQTRFTRTQQRERAVKEAEGTLEGPGVENGEAAAEEAEEEQPLDADPHEFAIPVAILSSLPADFYIHLASSKWKDRKEIALDPLLALLRSSVKLESGNYDELVRALAGKMSDANVVCVTAAANCLESLALGLRSDFARYQAGVVALILERTKEKKTSVLDALGGALDAIFLSVSISDVIEDIALFLKHKNPSVKAETLKWLVRCLKITPTPPSKNDNVSLMAAMLPALEDSGEPVRVAAAEALGTLMKCVGERALQGQIDGLDGLRKEKVMEWFEKAVVKCKASAPSRAAAAAPPAPVAVKPKPKPIAPKPASPSEFDGAFPAARPPPKAAPAPRPLAKKPLPPAAAPPAVKKAVVAAAPSKAPPPKAVEALRYKFTQEDAELQADSVIPAPIRTGLFDSNWKERLAAMESMHSWLSGGEIENVESELIVRYLSKKPGWKESNFQVGAKMFGILHLLAESSPSFAKASAALSIPGLSDKLGDMKLKKPAGDALTIYAEKSSLQFVLSQAYEPMTKQKAPKAQADTLVWIEQSLRDFGVSGLSVRDLIEFLKAALKSTNAAVRASATKAIVTLKLCVGSDISSFLQDVNPALLTTIQAEFDKISGETAPAPTRSSADNTSAATSSSAGGSGAAKGSDADDALDQLFPRVDLEKLLSNATVNACNDANWKTRKEALESIQSTLEANKRLKPSNLSDLTTALKLRLSDSNKVVQNLALDVVTRIATGMGKPFERQARILAGAVATVLADQKANIRASGVTALSAMADAAGLDTLISGFDKPLEAQNPVLRKELLAWLESRFEDKDVVASLDVTPIVGAVVNCLEDRNTDVRKSAAAILPVIVARAGYDYVIEQTSSLKPASRATVLPLIEAARGSSTSAPKAAAPVARTGGLKTLRRPEPSTAPTPPSDEPASRLGLPRPGTSLPSIKPKSSASSARSTPVPPPVASSSTLNQAPFKSADGQPKLIRQSKDVGSNKWIIDGTPRPEQVEFLYSQMAPHTNPDLLAQLFSKDHNAERDFGAALALLDDCVREPGFAVAQYDLAPEELAARMVANADLIFKYITLRIVLTNTTITVKCLDLIDHLIPVMATEGHRLSDYEVNALLLSLVTKLGDGKEVIRQRVRAILRSLCTLYPFSKVFNLILDTGLGSKNARTRAESAEELGNLFQRYGVSSLPIAKALPVIARLIGDRDATVRSSALLAIGVVYSLVGADVVYKHIGAIPDKERSMLDERLKRTSSPTKTTGPTPATAGPTGTPSRLPARTIPAPGGISRIGQGLKRPTNVPISTLAPAAPILPSSSPSTNLRQPNSRDPSPPAATRPTALARPNAIPTPRKDVPTEVDPLGASHLIDSIVTDDFTRSVEALKMVQVDIASDPTSLLPFADRLIDAISQQTSAAFNGLDMDAPTTTLRLCKHLMQTLSGFFDHKTLGEAVSAEALAVLMAELAGRLLDTAGQPAAGAVGSLSKVLNMVLIRIFHHADQNACFAAIFTVLRDATIDLRELEGDELAERTEYADLVMKCLWKVSKSVKESLENESLSPSRLLRVINDFLVAIPPAEWRRRATDGIALADMPLRTMKTILSAVVSVCDKEVTEQLFEIPEAETSYVYHYLVRMLNNLANGAPSPPATIRDSAPESARGGAAATRTTGLPPTRTAAAVERPAKLSEGAIDIATNRELAAIFERIGDPGQSRAGIAELHAYRKEHPIAAAKIETWMSTTGTYFQTYLKRALDNLAINERERGASTPSSPHDRVAGSAIINRPLSNTSSRRSSNTSSPARPISRSARLSTNSGGATDPTEANGATPGAAGRLQELQSLFGFKDATNGTME